jgi:hypothetical protein
VAVQRPLADHLEGEVDGNDGQQSEEADEDAQHDGQAEVEDEKDPAVAVVDHPLADAAGGAGHWNG